MFKNLEEVSYNFLENRKLRGVGYNFFFSFNIKLLQSFLWSCNCRNYSDIQKCFSYFPQNFILNTFTILKYFFFCSLHNGDLQFVERVNG